MQNTLYYGDNLDILQRYVADDSIDLIYLDPPFNSKATYNILYSEKNGTASAAQIKAFEDTWHWDRKAEEAFIEAVERSSNKRVADLIIAFRSFLGSNDMMAYLVMMAIRLVELQRVLKGTGSIYLHCDPTASHYLKLLMDAVFEGKNFQNEIVWGYGGGGASTKRFARKHDIIFFYTKSSGYTFNPQFVPYKPHSPFHSRGEPYRKEGKIMEDHWLIPKLGSTSKEDLRYPTQKPERLIELIVKASSNEGNIVLDPFCGCGTTITVAEKLKRRWVGIDVTHLAVSLMRYRLRDTFGDEVQYKVIGEPVDLRGAEALKEEDPYQFEWWALGLVGARPTESEKKRGADRGIDGYIYFHDDPKMTETKTVIIQVKSGHVTSAQIRDLKGVVGREKAQIGVFITFNNPTRDMRKEAVSAGYYKSPLGHRFPKIQILTIEELLQGGKIDYPSRADATFKKAERHTRGEQLELKKHVEEGR